MLNLEMNLGIRPWNCHIALAPKPWISSNVGFDGSCFFGIQQCMIVPSPRSVVDDLRPDRVKE